MGLFRLNEDIHDVVNTNASSKYAIRHDFKNLKNDFPNLDRSDGIYSAANKKYGYEKRNADRDMHNATAASASVANPFKASSLNFKAGLKRRSLDFQKRNEINNIKNMMHVGHMGVSDKFASYKEEAEINDVSTSPAVKKFLNINSNSSDLNAVKPNQEYNDSYDKFFVADGDDPETSKFNIPAALAAKTAGGDPCPNTFNNGVNKVKSSDVFKLKPVKDETEETSFRA